jgi:uncharacterized repeat protein (TIGR01451 family)
MSRARQLTWRLLISITILIAANITIYAAAGFDPVITMLGVTSQVRVGEQIEWLVSFSNNGTSAGQNIVLSATLGEGLQVDNVSINTGTTSINGRTVTVSIPVLEPHETIQFSIFSTILETNDLSNMACVTAANLSGESCVRGLPIQSLPNTGESASWRQPMLWLSLLVVSVSILLIGMGTWGIQTLQNEEDVETAKPRKPKWISPVKNDIPLD